MSRAWRNFILDLVLLVTFIFTGVSGLVLFFLFPRGHGGMGRGVGHIVALGLPRHTWVEWHNRIGLLFILLAAVHLGLHWRWLVTMARRRWGR